MAANAASLSPSLKVRAGTMSLADFQDAEGCMSRSAGHCMTMGTASTMTSVAESLGFTLPGAASIPAVDANHARMATSCGRRIVEMVWEDLKPTDIMTMQAIENALNGTSCGGSGLDSSGAQLLEMYRMQMCRSLINQESAE